MATHTGASRSRLAARESFFGGPLSTREFCKAPNWQDLLKHEAEARSAPAPAAKHDGSGLKAASAKAASLPREPSHDPELLRKQKIKARRDFSGLNDEDNGACSSGGEGRAGLSSWTWRSAASSGEPGPRAGPTQQHDKASMDAAAAAMKAAAAARLQGGPGGGGGGLQGAAPFLGSKATMNGTASGAVAGKNGRGSKPQRAAGGHASTHVVVVRGGGGAGRGSKGSGGRKLAVEPMAVGKGRKQLANEALQARCDALREQSGRPAAAGKQPPQQQQLAAASPAGPTTSVAAVSPSPAAAAAATAAVRKAREAAGAKGVLQKQHQKTGLGMQTQLLYRRPAAAAAAARQAQQGATQRAAPAASPRGPAELSGIKKNLTWQQLSPQQRQRWLEQKKQQLGGQQGRQQGRGAFYGGKQPQGVLDKIARAKRRLSIDSQGSLDDFIADEEEDLGYEDDYEDVEGGEDWRAALREALGGYDPSKYAHIDRLPDRDMEAGWSDIVREEARSKKIARDEDAREEELERLREANKREKKRRKKGAASFLDDD